MKSKRTILLTGATGFLGSNLLGTLTADGYDIMVLARRSSDLSRLKAPPGKLRVVYAEDCDYEALFRESRIDAVVHCATNYGRRMDFPVSVLEANLMLPLKLLQIGQASGLKCFLNTDTILDKRVNYYSLSKSQFRDWLKLYSGKLACVNVSLEHFYGPDDDDSKFVTWAVQALINGSPKLELTPGYQKRDFIYIDDVCGAFSAVLRNCLLKGSGFYSYEVGSGEPVTIRDFVALIKRLARNEATALDFGAIPYRENEVMEHATDLSGVMALGWRPKVSLRDGLARTVEFETRRRGDK
ncbi:MAG: NAD(P)-dependent oxidoreductase [Elusimicrobia bacterium]|nr:NAD(P)-dependent oxidoreductase [Elusimicrobiota bacterium]